MNYKNNLLSLVTIMALSGTVLADGGATYIRLTSDNNDSAWTLFGVNGFSDGVASSRSSSSAGFSSSYTSFEDTDTQDDDSTLGLSDMLSVQCIDDTTISKLEVAAEELHPFEAKEPVRTMYIKINSNTPNVKIDYKASMEGQPLELQINDVATLYAVTINHTNTYSNPALAVESSPVSSASGNAKLSTITDVLDYNFIDNPIEAKYWDKDKNLDTDKRVNDDNTDADSATFYHYDSVSQQWKVWDKKFSGVANDFTALSQGDAYWGQVNTTDGNTSNAAGLAIRNDKTVNTADAADINVTASGLVLGNSGKSIPDSTVYAGKLTEGWNMVAIDPSKQYIRHAGTGLIATMANPAAVGSITITDSTGVYSVDVNFTAADTIGGRAKRINRTIEAKKLLGEIASSVNIKAFPSGATQMVFISDAQFTLEDKATDDITAITTLAGDNPYDSSGVRTTTFGDLGTAGALSSAKSVYGEYSLIVDVLTHDLANDVADGTTGKYKVAADLDSEAAALGGSGGTKHSAMIRFGTSIKDYDPIALLDDSNTANHDTLPDASTAKASIEKHALFTASEVPASAYGKAFPLDTDSSGQADKMIITSTVPFYIKDNTFTRVFDDYNATNNGATDGTTSSDDRTFEVVGKQTATITPILNADKNATARLISNQADVNDGDTGVYADWNASKLIAVSSTLSTFDIKDLADGENEFFRTSTSSVPLAKGAVAGVYSISSVAQLPVIQETIVYKGITLPPAESNVTDFNITIAINQTVGSTIPKTREYNITDINSTLYPHTSSGMLKYFDFIVEKINLMITRGKDGNQTALHGYGYHTFEAGDSVAQADLSKVKIGIVGLDINASTSFVYQEINTSGTTGDLLTIDLNNTNYYEANSTNTEVEESGTLGTSWSPLVGDLKTNAIYTPDFAAYGPLYTFFDAGFSVRSMLKATTDYTDQTIAWDGIDLTRDEDDWFENNEFNLFNVNLHSGYWVYLEPSGSTSITIGAASYTPIYTYYFDNVLKDEYATSNIINGGQFTVEITGFNGGITNAFVTVAGEEVQLKRNGISDNYTADFMKYSLTGFSEGSSGPLSFDIRATDGKGEYATATGVVNFDYTKPVVIAPTAPNNSTVKFNVDDVATTDAVTYHAFKEYIPELDSSRASTDASINRLIGSYPVSGGAVNICSGLTFGEVSNIRYVAADGTGVIGTSNVSDAVQFAYGTMLKGSYVLSHLNGDGDKKTLGITYTDICETDGIVDTNVTANKGVSLKSLESSQLSRLAFEPIAGIGSSLSEAWLSTYSIGGVDRIQVQNLEEYAGKPFFVEYNGKMYRSAFPSSLADAEASSTESIPLDDSKTFLLTSAGVRDTTDDITITTDNGTGEEITILNSSLAP